MLKDDRERYGLRCRSLMRAWLTGHAYFAVRNYRIASWLYRHGIKGMPDMITFHTLRRYGCEISPYAKIGGGFFIPHTPGIVIGHQVVAGKNLEIFQGVTIGSNRKECDGRFMPIIGNNVSIGSGAVVVGAITIGDNAIIGANSYVDKDVPAKAVVAGCPAKIIRYL